MTAAKAPAAAKAAPPRRVVLVSGLSGAGKTSILHALEDLGFEAVDNPPLAMVADLIAQGERPLAIGVDARTSGFRAEAVLRTIDRLKRNPGLRIDLVFAAADEAILLRRYTETRRRHPLAPEARVSDGIAAEIALLAPLRASADLLIDTSDLPPGALRALIEARFGAGADQGRGLVVSLMSFAYPAGLPREADLVFDARFLRNPHYDPALRPLTGLDPAVKAYIEADPDHATYLRQVTAMLALLLPRFVAEGKKYATIAIGCTGGRHRSVHLIERIAGHLQEQGWGVTRIHRELARADAAGRRAPMPDDITGAGAESAALSRRRRPERNHG
jgi:UPF0042 nucleotide-binding protein